MTLDIRSTSPALPSVGDRAIPYSCAPGGSYGPRDSAGAPWLAVGALLGRGAAGAFTGATLALATPTVLGVTAIASGVGALISGAQLAASGVRIGESRYRDDEERPLANLMKVAIASVTCVASTLGAGLGTLALPITLPGATLAGAWFNDSRPFSVINEFLGAYGDSWGFGCGFEKSHRSKMTGLPARAVPAAYAATTQQQCSVVPAKAKMGAAATPQQLPAAVTQSSGLPPAAAKAKVVPAQTPVQQLPAAPRQSVPTQAPAKVPAPAQTKFPDPYGQQYKL